MMRSFGAGVSASHCSGCPKTWPLSSASTILSTVTRGTPPALLNARARPVSISPSSAMSLSSRLSAILASPRIPNARAISRLPAGWPDAAMKSRICFRLGRSAERLRGIDRLMIVIPDLIRDPLFLHAGRCEGRQAPAQRRGDD